MQTIHNLRTKLLGCVLLALCSGSTIAAEARISGKTGDILADSRMIVVRGNYYYVDKQAPIHADWTTAPVTLDELRPRMNIDIRVAPASAGNSLPHIREIWVYAE